MDQQQLIDQVRTRIRGARRIAVLTGAGVSAESGVPTFRGDGGLWKNHNAMELATPEAFARNPALVWEFYNWRRELIARVQPNSAHHALARLERQNPGVTLITQNVDGLHRRAGSSRMLEIHGNLWRVRCTGCGTVEENFTTPLASLPLHGECGGLLRPDVVWFGESLDPVLLNAALEAVRDCQVMLVIGTSALVQPAASLALTARQAGAFTVEVNLERTVHSDRMDAVLLGPAGELVPRIVPEP